MKYRSFYLSAAFIGMLAGVHCIPAFSVPASAGDVTLNVDQTRALFGDNIYFSYWNGTGYESAAFTYEMTGTIESRSATYGSSSHPYHELYNPAGHSVVVYKWTPSDLSNIPVWNYNNMYSYTVYLSPVIDISGLNVFRMSAGVSVNYSGISDYQDNFGSIHDNFRSHCYFTVNTDNSGSSYQNYSSYIPGQIIGSSGFRPLAVQVDCSNNQSGFVAYCNQILISNSSKTFSVRMGTLDTSDTGVYNNLSVSRPVSGKNVTNNIQNTSAFSASYYLYIECPQLSDSYTNNRPSEDSSSGGGGYDGPDYSEQLALILAKLDLIINNDFNFDVNLDADLSGVESRLDGINSRLDGANSRLDGNNSRIDGVNSRLDGVNSRLDGISGELHNLNSAPSGTLPRTGAENSEFDHQAEMYLSDFQNEYSDPENQPFEVAEGSSGFLSFVREFLLRSHLAGVLPVLALLFIVHYTIFDRRG